MTPASWPLRMLGDEYFSWYVQLMLPYGTGISLYIVFLIAIVFVHSFLYLKKSGIDLKCQTEIINGTS